MCSLCDVLKALKAELSTERFAMLLEVLKKMGRGFTLPGATNFILWAAGGSLQLKAARYFAGLTGGTNILGSKRQQLEEALSSWTKAVLRTGVSPIGSCKSGRARAALAYPIRARGRSSYTSDVSKEILHRAGRKELRLPHVDWHSGVTAFEDMFREECDAYMRTIQPFVKNVQKDTLRDFQSKFITWGADGSAPGHRVGIYPMRDEEAQMHGTWDVDEYALQQGEQMRKISSDTSKYLAMSSMDPGHAVNYRENVDPKIHVFSAEKLELQKGRFLLAAFLEHYIIQVHCLGDAEVKLSEMGFGVPSEPFRHLQMRADIYIT